MPSYRGAILFYVGLAATIAIGTFVYFGMQASAQHKRDLAQDEARRECLDGLKQSGYKLFTSQPTREEIACNYATPTSEP